MARKRKRNKEDGEKDVATTLQGGFWNEWLGILLLMSLASHLHLELFERCPFRPSAGG